MSAENQRVLQPTRTVFRSSLLALIAALMLLLLSACGQSTTTKANSIDGKLMVRVSAGQFLMGTSPSQEAELVSNYGIEGVALRSELAQHTVDLGEFYIDQTPVTNAEYKKFIDAHPSWSVPFLDMTIAQGFNWDKPSRTFPAGREQYPVVMVTWQDARAYCEWAGGRLPTEAEWEKAARGTDGRIWPWGNQWDATKLNSAESGNQDATPVGKFAAGASPYGVLDMVGNVWQWTSSLEKPYPYDPNDGREDLAAQGLRVTRGGSWLFGAAITRTATRSVFEPDRKSLSLGFRCVQ